MEKKNPLVFDTPEETTKEQKDFKVTPEEVNEVEKEIKTSNVPPEFIKIKLLSNGKIEGIPEILHFRDFTSKEALEITTASEDTKYETICNVLTKTCYEGFEIKKLTEQDIIMIMLTITANFISPAVDKYIYIDPNKEEGLNDSSNLELVKVSLKGIEAQYLGTDENDNVINEKFKVPFTLKDSITGKSYKFKLPCVNDVILATKYVKDFYIDRIKELSSFSVKLESIRTNPKSTDEELAAFTQKNFDDAMKYKELQEDIVKTTATMIQSLQIVAIDDKTFNEPSEQWKAYEEVPDGLIKKYSEICDEYDFGIKPELKVYSPANKGPVVRPFRLEIDDFIDALNNREGSDRFDVAFE